MDKNEMIQQAVKAKLDDRPKELVDLCNKIKQQNPTAVMAEFTMAWDSDETNCEYTYICSPEGDWAVDYNLGYNLGWQAMNLAANNRYTSSGIFQVDLINIRVTQVGDAYWPERELQEERHESRDPDWDPPFKRDV